MCNWITSIPMHLVHIYSLKGSNSPNWIYFILGYSSCANWKKPQGWHPSKCWKCGTRVWRLCSKIGRALYILYRIQIITIDRNFSLSEWSLLLCFYYVMVTLDQFHKADRGAHNYYLEKGIVDSRPDHILNLIHYEVRMAFHLKLILLFTSPCFSYNLCFILLNSQSLFFW